MKSLLPKSLVGQLLVVVALVLLVAQVINGLLLLGAAQNQNLIEASTTAVLRIAAERERPELFAPRQRPGPRRFRRVELLYDDKSAVTDTMRRLPELEDRATQALGNRGIGVLAIEAGMIRYLPPELTNHSIAFPRGRRIANGTVGRAMGDRHGDARIAGYIVVSAQVAEHEWASVASAVRARNPMIWRSIILQTGTMYLLLLVPLVLFGRYVSRPLTALTEGARRFEKSGYERVEESGPPNTRQLICAYNEMGERVTSMLDEKDVMLGAIGHDLRTPLAALRVRVENVEDETERQRMIDGIEDMDRTLDDILSLARIGRSKEQAENSEINALVETVVDEFVDLGSPVSFSRGERSVASVRSTLIRRALRNLVSNAVKYGKSASLTVEKSGDKLMIHVDDEGPGIPENRIQAMFEPFARAEGSRNRQTGGAGLGLTLARAIARDHGGDVILENRQEGGLRASLALPT